MEKLNEVVDENERIRKALISNNEDEHNTNILLGETLLRAEKAEIEVSRLNKRFKNSSIGFFVFGTGLSVGSSLLSIGLYNDDLNRILAGASLDIFSLSVWCLCHYYYKVF